MGNARLVCFSWRLPAASPTWCHHTLGSFANLIDEKDYLGVVLICFILYMSEVEILSVFLRAFVFPFP